MEIRSHETEKQEIGKVPQPGANTEEIKKHLLGRTRHLCVSLGVWLSFFSSTDTILSLPIGVGGAVEQSILVLLSLVHSE